MAKDTITLETAQAWATKWKEEGANYLNNNQLKAFLIPGIDLTQVLAEEGVVDARSYLGIDDNNQPHLMIVGVDANGKDMVDNGIFDFTLPCPNTCDTSSPIYIK